MAQAVIVGGGVAGMTAGIYARRAGVECEILEKQEHMGGNLTGWYRRGCRIDNCIHWLNGSQPGDSLHRVWREIGMADDRTVFRRNRYLYESERNGERVGLSASPEMTRQRMLALSPEDKNEINRLIRTAEALIPFVGAGRAIDKLEIIRCIPDVLRYWKSDLYHVAERFRHPLLRLLLTDYIGGEFSAMALLCVYAAFIGGNAAVPIGGSLPAAERIATRCQERGCVLRSGVSAEKIEVRNGKAIGVRTETGEFYPADYVIAACDPGVTFGKLLPAEWMPVRMKSVLHHEATPLFSSIHAAFFCDSAALEPFGTRVIPAPEYSVRSGGRLAVREYSAETDAAPEGKTLLQTMVFQTEPECAEWISLSADRDAYRQRKEELSRSMAEAIKAAMPALCDSLEPVDFWTPATYHRYFGNRCGAYLAPVLTPRASLRKLPDGIRQLPNFSLATQWTRLPGGLPCAALAGVAAAEKAAKYCRR